MKTILIDFVTKFIKHYSVRMLCACAMSATTWAIPIEELWTSNERSYDLHAVDSSRFVIENSNRKNIPGKIAKFSVKRGDQFKDSTGERSEIVLGGWQDTSPFRVNGSEGVEYYSISVKLGSDWVEPVANSGGYMWGSVFQLHGPNEYMAPPSFALQAEGKFNLFLLGGDLSHPKGGRLSFDDGDLNLGRWVDFVLQVKWAIDGQGFVGVYRRDEGELGWRKVLDVKGVPTLQYRGDAVLHSHYWKAGFYRSESPHDNTLWLGPIARGRSFDDVTK